MRPLPIICLSIFLGVVSILATPRVSYAATYEPKGFVPATAGIFAPVVNNPGKSAGIVGCAAVIAFFPPAAIWCAVSVAGGVTVDEVME